MKEGERGEMEFDFIPFICSLQPESEFTIPTFSTHSVYQRHSEFFFTRVRERERERERREKKRRV